MADQKQDPKPQEGAQNGPSEAEIRQESAKAAEKALEAQKKAEELKQAAQGAADADERQKLMEEAIDKQIEAESFGKTAKYMRGGAFQGMCVGAGLGTAPGLTLGALTGTLVGGLTSTILGGLGAGLGSIVGWAHGPFWNMGQVIGKGVRKVTGDLPSWEATDEQKKKLEEMISQANQEEMPGAKELRGMANDGWDGAKHQGKAWYKTGASYMPGSRPYATGKASDGAWQSKIQAKQDDDPVRASPDTVKSVKQASRRSQAQSEQQSTNPTSAQRGSSTMKRASGPTPTTEARKQPRKLERRSNGPGQDADVTQAKRGKPRKLEVRS
ncbi:hypothetical protein CB0940_06206 [Cercospora beticola]|uniref:Uncharacterized protein n=1 Tax=Cercospora beticola TaxID=122368 RepID=A0A2G5HZ03_CERBT|nr:hypothetical protein CB0940_06206 [Cercospora beticola]PIA97769.1 hypothetical protein CB0940_06206 [Cercospora beticola]WPA98823.1 hypothetical protein RHO25_003436 [Cercospora beticola]CAK1360105.1 unnamed protein product [Cercospora beticola]